jgi:V/A-type H+-transporting ATPase subunit I
MEGWVPVNQEPELQLMLQSTGSYYTQRDPQIDENVPVLLKNNQFTKLFEMVGSLYSLPNYREIDLTPFFAPFFMLFFGFCLGDAGYGLLMMIATLILRQKAKPDIKPIWTLGFLFGISTFIMGVLGGTFFGILLIDLEIGWLKGLQKIMLDQNQLMVFSIALGLIQIVFGMCLKAARAIKMEGLKYALSTIGWIIIIIGVGGSFGLSSKGIIDKEAGKYLMIVFGSIGGIFALFFNSPGKNLFLNFGLGLWDTYGTVTGLLGDVLSYIRLFALGLSSAVLGSVFNQLAFELTGSTPVVSQLLTLLILLVGHSINFFMAALGSFVHPLRLTFVEFYKNTGFSGGGKKYEPFRRVETKKY